MALCAPLTSGIWNYQGAQRMLPSHRQVDLLLCKCMVLWVLPIAVHKLHHTFMQQSS